MEVSNEAFVTKGGYTAVNVNGLTIRSNDSNARLVEDDETFEEYKVRLKFVKRLKKRLKIK